MFGIDWEKIGCLGAVVLGFACIGILSMMVYFLGIVTAVMSANSRLYTADKSPAIIDCHHYYVLRSIDERRVLYAHDPLCEKCHEKDRK